MVWDGCQAPCAGEIISAMDPNRLETMYKVYDGHEWHSVPEEAMQDLTMREIQCLIMDRKNFSDSFLETEYPDLRMLRERHEIEYETLRNKYKTFEILRIGRGKNATD